MARETKVGLLAGLAFIVCFAVILANRGRNGPPGLSDSILTNSGIAVPFSPQKPTGTSTAPARPNVAAVPAANTLRTTEGTPVSGSELPGERLTSSPVPMTPRESSGPVSDPNREALERILASRSQPTAITEQPSVVTREIPAPATPAGSTIIPPVITGRANSVAAPPADRTPEEPRMPDRQQAPGGREYTVQAQDTLSSIAAEHYGTKSHSVIQAIFDANRSVMTDPDHVRQGAVLVLPSLSSATPSASSHPIEAAKPVEKLPVPPTDGAIRWYQVKKNDRYAGIAREQLGDESRWKEIYELNKDKFPDAQRIREGVRIKLPPQTAVTERGSRR